MSITLDAARPDAMAGRRSQDSRSAIARTLPISAMQAASSSTGAGDCAARRHAGTNLDLLAASRRPTAWSRGMDSINAAQFGAEQSLLPWS